MLVDKENIAFVRNLPLTVCKDDFEEVMSQFGKVNGISIISQSVSFSSLFLLHSIQPYAYVI